jgi:hypothetical protein
MNVRLADGYNGHTCLFNANPIERDGTLVKLSCAEPGKEYLTVWKREADVASALSQSTPS